MAATEIALSETLKSAKGEIDNTILEILAQQLCKDSGILSPVLHPAGFFEADKPLWERINSPSRDNIFSAWLYQNITLDNLNAALFEKCRGRLPKDITYSDYVDFMEQQNKDDIFRFLFEEDPFRRSTIESIFQKSLLDSSTREERKKKANTRIESFDETFQVNTQTFEKNKEDIANLDLSITNFCNTHDLPINYLMCFPRWLEDKEGFNKITAEHMTALEKKLADLEQQLTAITPVLNPTGKLIDETLWDVKTVLEWVKQRIALSEEIQLYSEAINTINELGLISAYEQEITALASELKITDVKATKIIALIVQGKTKPYLPILTPQEYQECLINIEKSKRDLYYRTARKEVDGLLVDPSIPILSQLSFRMRKIVSIIELASYDVGLGGEIIRYKVDDLEKEKKIPKTLFLYRKALLDLIAKSEDLAVDVETYRQHFNKEMARLVDSLMKKKQMNQDRVALDNSIHYRMHLEFLTSLRAIIEPVPAPQAKSKAIEIIVANGEKDIKDELDLSTEKPASNSIGTNTESGLSLSADKLTSSSMGHKPESELSLSADKLTSSSIEIGSNPARSLDPRDLTHVAHSNPSDSFLFHQFAREANIMRTTASSADITDDAITLALKGKAGNGVNALYQIELNERAARRKEKEEESRPAFTRLHVRREMPTDFSNIKDGYLLILPHTVYHVDSEYLYPCPIKKTDLFSKKLEAFCNSRLDAYTPSLLMDSLVEWQTQELQSSDKRILLFAEEGNLHKKGNLYCKMCLPNGNTISITLEKMPYSINNLPLIKKAVLTQIKDNNLLSPIDLTSSEVSSLITANTTKASHEQRIKISKLAKPNPSSFQAEDAGIRARNSLPQLSASLPASSSAFHKF